MGGSRESMHGEVRGGDAWGGSGEPMHGEVRGCDAWGGSGEVRGGDAWGGSRRRCMGRFECKYWGFASNDPDLRDSSTPNVSSSKFKILDPNVSQTKGRKKGREVVGGSSRMKSGLEMATKKIKGCAGRVINSRDTILEIVRLKQWDEIEILWQVQSDDPDVLMEEDGDNRDE
ncbi:hypothetical protein Dimus_035494 [Dionaea muscipula]